ncbi:MAG TPA: hypothetical protein VFT12_04475, partial [Thermoanaerobaculia bacterium]|nr:hypothetical protein [Thermoanaerobaculia bacterium]
MRSRRTPTCTYVVPIDAATTAAELKTLASYLSTIGLAGCDVVVLDPASPDALLERQRILRWVARHVAAPGDVLETAVALAATEKIIVAAPESRYTVTEIESIRTLLDHHEVVEPAEFVEPMPWWGAIDA